MLPALPLEHCQRTAVQIYCFITSYPLSYFEQINEMEMENRGIMGWVNGLFLAVSGHLRARRSVCI